MSTWQASSKRSNALLDAAQLDAVGAGLLLVPAGADAELQSPAGDDVQRGGHVGQHRGMAVVDSGDQGAQAQPVVAWASAVSVVQPSRHGPARVGEDRVEVVEGPAGLEDVDVVGGLPDRQHVGPGGVLR